jgi:hypothetical protein
MVFHKIIILNTATNFLVDAKKYIHSSHLNALFLPTGVPSLFGKQLNHHTMLTKEKCLEAIMNWEIARSKYSKIESLIPPATVFNFNSDQCKLIQDGNKYKNLHGYIGINDDQLILIIVFLDAQGKEISAPSYVTSLLGALENELTLIEKDTITTKTITTISTLLGIKSYSGELKTFGYSEPTIMEEPSVNDIERWKNHYLDWFYHECNDFNGQRIFRAFTIPFADLKSSGAVGIFAFKDSLVYQRPIPILIFIALDPTTSSDSTTQNAQFIRSSNPGSVLDTNTKDYSQPCPPMSRLEKKFGFLS